MTKLQPKSAIALNEAQLAEFRLRHHALAAAQHNFLLVQEAYQAWVAKILQAHGLTGEHRIDITTGEIRPNG